MAHKSKLRGSPPALAFLPQRIDRARREGRYQQALELSRQLYKQDPSEVNLGLLRQATFERGQQLESQKQIKEAATVYGNAAEMGGAPDFQRQVVERLAACGAAAQAQALAAKLGDGQLAVRLQGFVVDAALRQGPAGRAQLAPDLQAQFDAILQAFQHAEAGQDEPARSALQVIGLQSPFLEWRVLLRGLLAYYQNDDQRALENWQRLDPQRLPARLAAPLRFGIDPAYRAAQPPAGQNHLRQQLERVQGSGLVPSLRNLQAMLSREDNLAPAFRQAEGLLASLRREAPDLVAQLAACFRWAIVEVGQPEDLDRYLRVFGPLPDDPHLHRVTALAMEKRGMIAEAHEAWKDFEKDVAKNSKAWPGEQAVHVRALILAHMGKLAADFEDDLADDDDFFPFAPRRRKKSSRRLKPSAEECFRRSLELAPKVLSTHEALFQHYVVIEDDEKALQAGKNLIEHFPDHAPTLEALSGLAMLAGNMQDAQHILEQALRANPLNRGLRFKLSKVHEFNTRTCALNKDFDQARTEWQRAIAYFDAPSKYTLLCLAAMVELKAKNRARYEELLAQATSGASHRLQAVYCLMCESIRLKVTPTQKKEYAHEFQDGLIGALEPRVAAKLVSLAVIQRGAGPAYHGQKTHEKKILAALEKQPWNAYDEPALEGLVLSLGDLKAARLFERACAEGQRRFPANPRFFLAEAQHLLQFERVARPWDVERLLKHARALIDALPRGENQQLLLEQLQELEEEHRDMAGSGSILGGIMNRFFGMGPSFDDEEDDDY